MNIASSLSRFVVAFMAVVMLTAAASEARPRPVGYVDNPPPHDSFSAAEPSKLRTLHLSLDLVVDFEQRRIRGTATHTIVNYSGADELVLDTRHLEILGVKIDGAPTTFSLGPESDAGRALRIAIAPDTRVVEIEYQTGGSGEGILWLDALQTVDAVAPLVYTFGEPDRTREWIPIQDTPGVRMTYEATIRVPDGMIALMTAPNPTSPSPDGVHHFEMPYPIAPYLIALAAGHFEFASLDHRTGIYAEPSFLEDAVEDLAYVPEMLTVAETILGSYPFDRYDVLLLPPSYAAGGMENPFLNFLNVAGVVRGDHEDPPVPLTVLAHEIAHSWAGDLATCGSWSDLWLNEGFATFYASRILAEMVSDERGEIGYYWDRINYESYMEQREEEPRFTVLHRQFLPDDTLSIFNSTNYRKGSLFLHTLESEMGRDAFDTVIRSYFRRFGWRWVNDRSLLDMLRGAEGSAGLRLDEWVYQPGLPANVAAPKKSRLWDRIAVEARRFRSGAPASILTTSDWTSFERDLFLWQIAEDITPRMAELDAAFRFSQMKTPPIYWFLSVAETFHVPSMPSFERFLRLGSWNVLSVYQRLSETSAGRKWALKFYKTARPRYGPGIQFYVDQILGLETADAGEATAQPSLSMLPKPFCPMKQPHDGSTWLRPPYGGWSSAASRGAAQSSVTTSVAIR